MAKAIRQPYEHNKEYVTIFCPACQRRHTINHSPGGWGFNGDVNRPTIEGSIGFHGEDSGGFFCHSFVQDGKIIYVSDSRHALAGQTFDLPDIEDKKD